MNSLTSLKNGLARVVQVKNSSDKNLKQLMHIGVVKGSVIEVLSNDLQGLVLLKKENSTFGISKELSENIFVQRI